jgi:hypothetical protein
MDFTNQSTGTKQPTTLNDQYNEFRQQVLSQPPIPHTSQLSNHTPPHHQPHELDAEEDLDMDAQLENVSLERGGSSLQLTFDRVSHQAAHALPNNSSHHIESTPPTLQYRNPRIDDVSESQSTKRRKADDYTAISTPDASHKSASTPPSSRARTMATLSIDMTGHMWFGFHMEETLAILRGKKELKESRTDEEFAHIGTPTNEIHEFRSLRRAFLRTKQFLYPNERPDAVIGQHLHFTQIPMYEKTSQDTGLTEGFHITIRFDGEYKKLNRKEVKTAYLD